MNGLINAMGLIVLIWSVLFILFAGLGLFIFHILGFRKFSADRCLKSFWVGWILTIAFLQIWHLFFCVDWRAFILLSVFSLFGFVCNLGELYNFIKANAVRLAFLLFILFILALILANRAVLPPLNSDSAFYHLGAISWERVYPIVPGLGNLNTRFASNNSSYFLYVALLGSFWHKPSHFANGILLLVLLAQILLSIIRIINSQSKDRVRAYDIYLIFWLLPITEQFFSLNLSSPSPDLPNFILGILLSAQALLILDRLDYESGYSRPELFYLILISFAGIVIRVNFIFLAIFYCLLIFTVYWLVIKLKDPIVWGLRVFILLFILIILPWVIRNVVLSGYFIYPSTLFSLNFDWKIPLKVATEEADLIYGWSRMPGPHWQEALHGWSWFIPWATKALKDRCLVVPFLLTVVSCLLFFIKLFTKKGGKKALDFKWLLVLPPLIAILFVFFIAPVSRFIGASFWIIGIGLLTFTIQDSPYLKRIIYIYIFLSVFLILLFLSFKGKDNFAKILFKSGDIAKASSYLCFPNIVTKGGENKGFYDGHQVKLEKFKTNSRLEIYYPVNDGCWDIALLCTSFPDENLRLRVDNNLKYGFSVSSYTNKDF
jgi:hypothetical protein